MEYAKVITVKACPKCDHVNPVAHEFCEECGASLPTDSGDGIDPMLGKMISGRYKIEELIGQGAMGRVYRALQKPIDRPIAVKILHQHLMEDRRVSRRFEREAQAASRFNHPNSINIIDFGQTEDGSLFLAMEYITGEDLAAAIRREAPLPPPRIVNIATQVLNALQLAHTNKIIHRDLKPENIMLEELPGHRDFVKVCDFGIAKIQQNTESQNRESALTMFGMICGTPYYMSPEQAKGEELDGRTDLYSMGVILYEMFTGEVPFRGTTPVEVIARHLTDPPAPISTAYPHLHIPRSLEKVVMRALSKNRDERFPDAQSMSQALETALKEVEFQQDLLHIVKEAETSPPIVVGKPFVEIGRTENNPAFMPHPSQAPSTPPVATAQAGPRQVTAPYQATPYTPPPPTVRPGTLVREAPAPARPATALAPGQATSFVQDSARQTFDGVSHTPLPHQAVRRSRSNAASTSYAGVSIQELDQEMGNAATIPRRRSLGKWLFLLLLLGGLGYGGYYFMMVYQPTQPEQTTPIIKKTGTMAKPIAEKRSHSLPNPIMRPQPRTKEDDSDENSNSDENSDSSANHTSVRTRPKPALRPRRTRPQPRPALRVAYISPSTQYQKKRQPLATWLRRHHIHISDLPPNLKQAWLNAERAAKNNEYATAHKELRQVVDAWPSLKTFPTDTIKRKLARVMAKYKKTQNNNPLSAEQNQRVQKALFDSQTSIFKGAGAEANRHLNQALKELSRH